MNQFVTLGLVVTAWLVLAGILLVGLYRRWHSRWRNGFFVAVLTTLGLVALMAASVTGLWGYEAARSGVTRQLVTGMQNVAEVVEQQMAHALDERQAQLAQLASRLLASSGQTPDELREHLRTLQSVEPHYVQIELLDARGDVLTSSTLHPPAEPANRIAAAFALDGQSFVSEPYRSATTGRQLVALSVPATRADGSVAGALTARFELQSLLHEIVSTARFNDSGYTVIVDGHDHILAHPDAARMGEDVSDYAAVRRVRDGEPGGAIVAANRAGRDRLFVYRTVENPSHAPGVRPWILLTEIDQSEALAAIRSLQTQFAVGAALVLVVILLIGQQLTRSIQQPLNQLAKYADGVRVGEFAAEPPVRGHDSIGRLGDSLGNMVRGLQERDRIRDLFGRYIATEVSEGLLKGEATLSGNLRHATVLMSDIRNFTAMSEQLGPQDVVTFLNDYFSEMVDAVFECGGVLDKFIGDGILAVFGGLGDQPDHARRAVQAALRMRAKLAKINGQRGIQGLPPIAIGIGIHTDNVIVGNIGSRKRLEYTVVGDGVNVSSRVEALNKQFGTTILITESTYATLQDAFECRAMPDAELRGRSRTFRLYEVVSEKSGGGTKTMEAAATTVASN